MISSVLVGQASQLTFTAYQDGTQTDLGTVTIGIEDANGDEVVASGTSVTDNDDGTYNYTLSKQTEPNFLIATWSVSGGADLTQYYDVQGSWLFTEHQLRNFDDQAISDTTTYTDADIAAAHQQAVEYMEAYTGRSWVRRYNRAVLSGTGSRFLDVSDSFDRTASGLMLNRPGAGQDIIQIIRANDGSDITTSNIQILSGGILQRTDAVWTKATSTSPLNVTVEYEYGQPYPVDGADRVAMLLARHWLVSTRVSDAATSYNDPLGTYTFSDGRIPWEAYKWLRDHRVGGYFA